jgi:hypothetical protein
MAPLPPNLSPITLANAGREYAVTVADHGKIIFLGDASPGARVATMFIQFVPSQSFTGTFAVVARAFGKPASDNGVSFIDYPFRRVVVAGVASDRTITTNTATPLADAFVVEVPANGVVIGLLTACTAGGGVLYSWPLNGPST